ncbi:MAG: inositol monophosphatase [Deltaproteobacteria bacterium]|nr:inositol monophosphatase [Deltaproteobacteria bacterium]
MKGYKEAAQDAATKAGQILKQNLGKAHRIEFKGEVDIVTDMDRQAERLIIDTLKEAFPSHGILTEEMDEVESSSNYRWVIDPLDGTTNYAHGFPIFCVSIALEERGDVVLGVIYNPMLDELFIAEKGKGATLNDNRIQVSETSELTRSLLATGFPYDIRTSPDNNLENFANFAVRAQAIRRAGSAALDLAYVACGRFDGFWELKLKPWDVAAGGLMIKEAGGLVTDFIGDSISSSGDVLATNGLIHKAMKDLMALHVI